MKDSVRKKHMYYIGSAHRCTRVALMFTALVYTNNETRRILQAVGGGETVESANKCEMYTTLTVM